MDEEGICDAFRLSEDGFGVAAIDCPGMVGGVFGRERVVAGEDWQRHRGRNGGFGGCRHVPYEG